LSIRIRLRPIHIFYDPVPRPWSDRFDADYAGLTEYFKSIHAALDDRSIRRGIIVREGGYIACQT
jgi:hypothetical protein